MKSFAWIVKNCKFAEFAGVELAEEPIDLDALFGRFDAEYRARTQQPQPPKQPPPPPKRQLSHTEQDIVENISEICKLFGLDGDFERWRKNLPESWYDIDFAYALTKLYDDLNGGKEQQESARAVLQVLRIMGVRPDPRIAPGVQLSTLPQNLQDPYIAIIDQTKTRVRLPDAKITKIITNNWIGPQGPIGKPRFYVAEKI